jgi:hypothetical protein
MTPFLSDHRFLAALVGAVLAVVLVDLVLQVFFHDANWWVVPGVLVGFAVGMWARKRLTGSNE